MHFALVILSHRKGPSWPHNFVGVESAAQGWFGKRAKELGIGEAAMLAAGLCYACPGKGLFAFENAAEIRYNSPHGL